MKEIELLNEKLESLGILGERKEEILKEFIKVRAATMPTSILKVELVELKINNVLSITAFYKGGDFISLELVPMVLESKELWLQLPTHLMVAISVLSCQA